MKFLNPVISYLESLNQRSFYLYYTMAIGIICFMAGGLIWWGSSSLSATQENLDDILQKQSVVQKILEKNVQTEQEQKHINKIIDDNPDFNLIEYVRSVFAQYAIQPSKETIQTVRTDVYEERNAQFAIDETDMKIVTEIMQTFDQNERVTLKELTIKPGPGRTINVVMTIAALYKKE